MNQHYLFSQILHQVLLRNRKMGNSERREHTDIPASDDNNIPKNDDIPNCKIDVNGEQTIDVSKIKALLVV